MVGYAQALQEAPWGSYSPSVRLAGAVRFPVVMDTYIMSHRTQITLSDDQYEWLTAESQRSGVALAALIRRAVDRTYGGPSRAEARRALTASAGAWKHRSFDGESYVEELRRGMASRLPD